MSRGGRKRSGIPVATDVSCDYNISAAEAASTLSTTPVVLFDNLSDDLRRLYRESVPLPSPSTASATLATPTFYDQPLANIGTTDDWDPSLKRQRPHPSYQAAVKDANKTEP